MKTTYSLIVALAASVLAGCKSDSHQAYEWQSGEPAVVQKTIPISQPYTGTNIFYQFDQGFFIAETDYNSMQMTGGTRVVIVDGHFPDPAEMPSVPVVSRTADPFALDLGRRDMSLIDDTTR